MRVAIAVASFALAGCASATLNKTSEEAAIRLVEAESVAAFNAHDAIRLAAVHAPDAVVMISNAPLAAGTSAIRSMFSDFFNRSSPSLIITPTTIDVANPTVATDIGTYTLTFDTPQGKLTDHGNYITIWHKVNGQWRIAAQAPESTTPLQM